MPSDSAKAIAIVAALAAAFPLSAAPAEARPMVETCLGEIRPLDLPQRDAPPDVRGCHAFLCSSQTKKRAG
jgi:hypothetical protein